MSIKKSEQVNLDASHNVWLQRNAHSPLLGLNNTGHLDSAVGVAGLGVQGLAVKEDLTRDAFGVVRKAEEAPALPGMKL